MGVSEISGNIGNKTLKALELLTFFDSIAVTTSVTSGYNSGNKTTLEKNMLPLTSFLLPLCYRKKQLEATAKPVGTAQKSRFVTVVTAKNSTPLLGEKTVLFGDSEVRQGRRSTMPDTSPESARVRVLVDGQGRHPTESIPSAKRQIWEALNATAQRSKIAY